MEWTDLKDWKAISAIPIVAAAIWKIIVWIFGQKKETAETIKAKAEASLKYAETRKINRELDSDQEKVINALRKELSEMHELARQLQKKIDRYEVRLSAWETFGPSLKNKQ